MTRPPNCLVFDLDGTLSDPAEGIGRSINFALQAFGHTTIPAAEVSRCIGPPLDVSFAQLVPQASRTEVLALVAKYRERYGEIGYAENRLYPGVPEALAVLTAAGVPLALCTSKRGDFAEMILQLFGLRQHFGAVSGGDIDISKAQQLAALLAEGRIGPGSVMIGDRAVDIVSARANALSAVGVLWGHGSETELREAAPERLLRCTDELVALRPAG